MDGLDLSSICPSRPSSPLPHSTPQLKENPKIRPPTSILPPLTRLIQLSTNEIEQALNELKRLYWPPIEPPSGIINSIPKSKRSDNNEPGHKNGVHSVPDSGYASAEEEDVAPGLFYANTSQDSDESEFSTSAGPDSGPDPAVIRADEQERTYSIKWITGFVARSDKWVFGSGVDEEEMGRRTEILDLATAILSSFLGDDDDMEVAVTRAFKFSTPTLGAEDRMTTISVELNDAPLLSTDHTSVGLQSWGSSILLAERICAMPKIFSIIPSSNLLGSSDELGKAQLEQSRILELGAGTGLLSIVTAKLIQLHARSRSHDSAPLSPPSPLVVATDYHPDVLENLRANVKTNFPSSTRSEPHERLIDVHTLDWEYPVYVTPPFCEPFDVILAADVIYHPEHAYWLKGVVEHLLVKPTMSSTLGSEPEFGREDRGGVFWMIIALRSTGRHEGLEETVDEYFPDVRKLNAVYSRSQSQSEWKLAVLEREDVDKVDGVGRADEGGYRLYKIGWVNVS